MKKLILLLLICSVSFAQNSEFVFSKEGFNHTVVLPFDGKLQADLYKKALQWIEVTYKNPKEVLKGNIENDYIRFIGVKSNLYCINAMGRNCYDVRYTIEIAFKDGKCKFDIIDLEYLAPYSQYSAGGWSALPLENTAAFYNKKGEIRNTYKYVPEIADYFNILKKDYADFIVSDKLPTNKNDW